MIQVLETDVAIIGGGPVGVALGAALGRAGVDVIVFDRERMLYPLPRAAHVDHEVMRIIQNLGAVDRFLPHTRPATAYRFQTADGQVLMEFNMPAGATPSGWPSSNMIHQPGLERALREELARVQTKALHLGWTFRDLAQDKDGVILSVDTPKGEISIRAAYAIGCDGATSTVRKALDIGLDDYAFDEPWLVIDVLVGETADLPDVNLQICDPARPTTCVLMGPGRHRWEFMLRPGESPEEMLREETIARLMAPWGVDAHVTIERKAVYRFHALVAESWRKGRVLLAGDAAHQMPPFAGQGLCSGLRDVANLSWKLAAVLAGEADPAILDSYQLERDPHVRAIIDLALMMGRTVCITDPEAAAERDRRMLAERAAAEGARAPAEAMRFPPIADGLLLKESAGAGDIFPQPVAVNAESTQRLDDALGPAAWLLHTGVFTPDAPLPPHLQVIATDDQALAPFRTGIEAWLDHHGVAAALVRPDRHVFGTGQPELLLNAYCASLKSAPPLSPGRSR